MINIKKLLEKVALGFGVSIFLVCYGCYMVCYDLKTWRFWHSAKCVTTVCKDGKWVNIES